MQLNTVLGKEGLMFPPNPGSEIIATIGGMVSTNASGHRAVKYGTTKDYIKGLKVVLADGTIVETGSITPKTSLGYDLTRLFCAAEERWGSSPKSFASWNPSPNTQPSPLPFSETSMQRATPSQRSPPRASSSPAARSWIRTASRWWRKPWAKM
jgi:hypothetical protein